jgi:hypothetical protein
MRFSIVILFTVLATSSTTAQQDAVPKDPLPDDADVRTAYCTPVLKWQIGMIRHMARSSVNPTPVVQQWVEEARDLLPELQASLNRFEEHLVARTMTLSTTPLVVASMHAESDIQQFELQGDRCSAQCFGSDKGDDAKQRSCWDTCVDKGVIERIGACRNPSWL